ncbi:MAG TPA: HAMP domain-containing sensor histidine kinase [Anaerolineae bacterium]|nr:HAMP domain-containing sensor histidine kinase [Anaerolineae bacterium]
MFRSIRWRLVASYVLLTLLTVSLVGVLALSLIKRYVAQQERDYLTANADAVARQALPLMQPVVRRADLHELARTASFLGNVQVKILDDRRRVVADSGQPTEVNEFVWIVTPVEVNVQLPDGFPHASIMVLPGGHLSAVPIPGAEPFAIFEQLPPETEYIVVHRTERPWGSRFVFGARQRLEVMPALPTADAPTLRKTLGGQAHPRSELVVTVPAGEIDRPAGYVELSKGPDFGAEALATARRAFLLAAGGTTLLAVVVGLLVSRGLTAPLRSLTGAAGQMSSGDLSIRAPARGRDEIGQLARQFNQMAERLEASFAELAAERDSLRRFIADASHELRTPVTALKNFNELLQGAAADDPAARAEFLAESQIQLDRLEWITHNLLDLSRLEAGLIALDVTSHDAGELIRASAATFKTLAHEKHVMLSVTEPPSPVQVRCDRARIELALSNLLENGLKFTPAGGQVEIGAEQAHQGVRLWVQDSGPGIAPADQPRIFERFYRGRGRDVEGTGLGLAIVRSIVQAHGGHVTVESQPGAGSRFVIELPSAD